MADKYLQSSGGAHQEVEGLVTSAGASDAGKIPALDAAGKLHVSMMPAGVGQDVKLILASEALAAGAFINIYDNAGAANCRLASAAVTDKEAHGFVLAGVADGENAQVYFEGENNQVTGATPGNVFLSDVAPGGYISTAPAGAGKIVQKIGVATSPASINFEAVTPVVLA